MRTRWMWVMAFFIVMGLAAPLASAEPRNDKGKGKAHAARYDRDDDRWERHDRYEVRIFGRDERPPGWSRGRKTGWGDCGMPPGQAKKYGCRSYVHNGRRYYWYRDDVGRIIVRRPRIDISVR